MRPKYSKGNKVRIKPHDFLGRILDPDIQLYENMSGEIIESTNVVAFIREPWANPEDSTQTVTVYHYTVRINDEITLRDVLEEYLEKSLDSDT